MSEELPEVKRSKILEAIEAGLRDAPWINDEDAERMREFGRTTPLIAIGTSHTNDAECPLYAVSIWNRHGLSGHEYHEHALGDFYNAFDDMFREEIKKLKSSQNATFKVIDG